MRMQVGRSSLESSPMTVHLSPDAP
jgi:hypothetical protein